jgi:hypothetical protein
MGKSLTTTIQAKWLGRVDRLAGNDIQSNPFELGTDNWEAYNEGWSRKVDEPLSLELRYSSAK